MKSDTHTGYMETWEKLFDELDEKIYKICTNKSNMKTDTLNILGMDFKFVLPKGLKASIIDTDTIKIEFDNNEEIEAWAKFYTDLAKVNMKLNEEQEERFYQSLINSTRSMKKTPEQRISELEKELAEIKEEMKPKELTVDEIVKLKFPGLLPAHRINLGPNYLDDKLNAIIDMIAVASHLNGDWKPELKLPFTRPVTVIWINRNGVIRTSENTVRDSFCYFKNTHTAEQAIKILGEGRIQLALT